MRNEPGHPVIVEIDTVHRDEHSPGDMIACPSPGRTANFRHVLGYQPLIVNGRML